MEKCQDDAVRPWEDQVSAGTSKYLLSSWTETIEMARKRALSSGKRDKRLEVAGSVREADRADAVGPPDYMPFAGSLIADDVIAENERYWKGRDAVHAAPTR